MVTIQQIHQKVWTIQQKKQNIKKRGQYNKMVLTIQQKGGTKQQEGVTLQFNIKGDNTVKKVEQYKTPT